MLSKVAERVYWMVRYLERAEDAARLVSVYGDLLPDLPKSTGVGWGDISTLLGVDLPRQVRGRKQLTDRMVLQWLLADPKNPGSILSSIAAARENARTSRDVLPTEAWRAVNEMHLFVTRQLPRAATQRYRNEVLAGVVKQCQQITGLLHGTMSHGPAYQFVRVGRFIERADMTTRVVDVAAALLLTGKDELKQFDNTLWMTVLRSVSGYQMYRQYVRRRVRGADVLNFLLANEEFPRAIRYCIDEVRAACQLLPNPEATAKVTRTLLASLGKAKSDQMSPAEIHDLIDRLQAQLAEIHAAVAVTWFSPEERRKSA